MTGEELKKLRELAGIPSQEKLAEILEVHKNTVYNYETSDHISPKKAEKIKRAIERFIVMKKNYDESITNLGDIEVKDPLGYLKTKAGTFYEERPDGKFRIHVPIVPFKAYASFVEVFEDEYQLHEAFDETYFTVDKVGLGKYIAFTTANESMNGGGIYDTPGGAEVLGRHLGKHHWPDGFNPTDYGWIIVSTTGIFHKDIENTDTPGKINCKSRNPSPEFSDFPLILDNIHSIWKVIKRTF